MQRWTRSLPNYQVQQAKVAKDKGLYEQLMRCRTLTQARKLLYGHKRRRKNCKKCHHIEGAGVCRTGCMFG